jgi:hypothetical protein
MFKRMTWQGQSMHFLEFVSGCYKREEHVPILDFYLHKVNLIPSHKEEDCQ